MENLKYWLNLQTAIIKRLLLNFSIYKNETETKGWTYVLKTRLPEFINYIYNHYRYKIFKSKRQFDFEGKKYFYFYHPYNFTWTNERSIEIPIFKDLIQSNTNKNILEIGNVLSHYFSVSHDILDKYEKAKNVINKDVSNFKSKKTYDLIISISTLEHVGWDERKKDRNKIPRSLNNLSKYLNKDGEIIFSVPIGLNPYLDNLINSNKLLLTKKVCYKRLSKDNVWHKTTWNKIKKLKFHSPYPFANGIVVGVIKK